MVEIVVMLGGDLPGTPAAMAAAVKKFRAAGVRNPRTGPPFRSAPEDCVPGTPEFRDMALCGEWGGTPDELLALCRRIEREAGRPEVHSSREARILDCDIILFGQLTLETPRLTIPHPRARRRRFVLEPLAALAPQLRFPDGTSVAEALAQLPPVRGAVSRLRPRKAYRRQS